MPHDKHLHASGILFALFSSCDGARRTDDSRDVAEGLTQEGLQVTAEDSVADV
ncbi:hypothetical protein OF83DRAFT_1176063 [Amylostereum chailletii]|nr:hypothetical protein OF83DRAFT_1176063 [Amylostereum chailletii]